MDRTPRSHRRQSIADVHFHPWNYAQQGTDPQELLPAMKRMHLRYTVLAPIPTSLLLRCGNCIHDHHPGEQELDEVPHSPSHLTEEQQRAISQLWNSYNPANGLPAITKADVDNQLVPNYYISEIRVRNAFTVSQADYLRLIQQDAPLYYDTGVDGHTAAVYKKMPEAERAKFDPMITGLALGDMRASEKLIMKLYDNPGVFTGVGEITVYKEWVQQKVQGELQANLTTQQCALLTLIQTCGTIGMPVVLHCDVGSMFWESETSGTPTQDHVENMRAFLSRDECRHTTIIWAHAGGLGKYARIRPGHLDNLAKILNDPRCAHVHFDLSWDTVADQLLYDNDQLVLPLADRKLNESKVEALADLIREFPQRFLFGSDSLSPNTADVWQGTEKTYAPLFDRLDNSVANAMRIGNYERLIVGARQRVRLWEKHCLPFAAIAILRRSDNSRPIEVIKALTSAIQDAIEHGIRNIALEMADPKADPKPFKIPADFLKRAATGLIVGNSRPWDGDAEFDQYLKRAHRPAKL